jgi:hypothetical protein
VGENAERVQTHLAERLSESVPETDWETEYRVENTPVDVAGNLEDKFVLVELEWRRADPADNAAKTFRHASNRDEEGDVRVFQVFTRYYELSDGGVSSKRKNAEFVGEAAAESLDGFCYAALTLGIFPPKRGGEVPEGWRSEVEGVTEEIAERLRG